MRVAFACLLLLGTALPAFGATTTLPSANYDIEVLVFSIEAPEFEGGELWTHADQPIDTSNAVLPPSLPPSADFSRVAASLRGDGRYRILATKHWVQAGDVKSSVPAMQLTTPDNEINGTLRFYLSRFLHVELNVMFQPHSPEGIADAAPDYVINEQRRVRSKELTYFDHPKFGVIVRVSPTST